MQGEGLYKTKPKIPSAMIEQTKTSAEAAAVAAAETKAVRKQLDELQAEREDRDVEEVRATCKVLPSSRFYHGDSRSES